MPRRFVKCLEPVEELASGCWRWTGALSAGYGPYARFYRAYRGAVPEGMTLDHLCHSADRDCPGGETCPHRACVNPHHLEPVPHRVNVLRGQGPTAANARKTHCPQGHPYAGQNLGLRKDGGRRCQTCNAEHQRAWRERQRKAA